MPAPDYVERFRAGLDSLAVNIEVWFSVPGWEGLYEASNFGRVRSLQRRVDFGRSHRTVTERILSRKPDPYGYYRVTLNRSGFVVSRKAHQVVLDTFVGPCPTGMECRHFPDRTRTNNRLDNIQWGTSEENKADMLVHGTRPLGEEHGRSKLQDADIATIHEMYESGMSARELAPVFGVSCSAISAILRGEKFKNCQPEEPANLRGRGKFGPCLSRGLPGERHPQAKLLNADVMDICLAHRNGESIRSITRRYKIDRTCIQGILRGTAYRDAARPS